MCISSLRQSRWPIQAEPAASCGRPGGPCLTDSLGYPPVIPQMLPIAIRCCRYPVLATYHPRLCEYTNALYRPPNSGELPPVNRRAYCTLTATIPCRHTWLSHTGFPASREGKQQREQCVF